MQNLSVPDKSEVEESLVELFKKAEILDRERLWKAITPIDPNFDKKDKSGRRAVSVIPEKEWEELKNFIEDFKDLLQHTKERSALQARIMMIVYCHILEADFAFTVIWNFLRVLNGLPEMWAFEKTRAEKKSICEYPSQKIPEVKELSNTQGLRIGETLHNLWNSSLRNAFSHSQYCICGDTILFTKTISPISRTDLSWKGDLTIQSLEKYYDGACALVDVFDKGYKRLRELATY